MHRWISFNNFWSFFFTPKVRRLNTNRYDACRNGAMYRKPFEKRIVTYIIKYTCWYINVCPLVNYKANGIEVSVYRPRIFKMWCGFCSLFIIWIIFISGPKVSSGAHQYLSNVQAGKSKRRETMVLKPRGNIDFHLLTTSVNAKYYY